MLSTTEENYLKAIFKLSQKQAENISTNNIAAEIQTTAASVSDMLKRLAEKDLISYEKYKGVSLTAKGRTVSVDLIRSHRLWEVFLVKHLGFSWDQVHEIAEELEHIKSPLLIERLDAFLGTPTHDTHGDPIPDAEGIIHDHDSLTLHQLTVGDKAVITSVQEQSSDFLQYLDKVHLTINANVEILESNPYDHSKQVKLASGSTLFLSEKVCRNLLVRKG